MKVTDVAGTALANTMRSKLRTFLTVVAIVIGAFTLTLTTGLGAGINKYVDNVVEGFGKPGELTVMKQQDMSSAGAASGSPQEYTEQDAAGGEMFGMPLLTQEDLAAIEDTEHVTEVKTYRVAEPEYIQGPDDRKWQTGFMGSSGEIDMLTFSAGRAPEAGAAEIVMPESWVEDLGAGDAEDLIGTELTVVAATPLQEHKSVKATVVGVTKAAASGAGTAPTPSESLEQEIYDITTEGLPESQRNTYFQATAIVEDPEANEDAVKQALADQGLLAQTLEEQLGVIRGIIDAVQSAAGRSIREIPDAVAFAATVNPADAELYRRRVRHVVDETDRTLAAATALTSSDLAKFRRLMRESHLSLRDLYEVTTPELDSAFTAAGELGARMTGGGFGGAVIALIPRSAVESTAQAIYDAAASRGFPEPTFLVARPGDGARRLA